MEKPVRALMIGAHPDDCDFRCGGLALKYVASGATVKYISLTNGEGGHHKMKPDEVARRRALETQAAAKIAGIEYEVWDVHDCQLIADLENRKRLIRAIREFQPDIIFTHRTNDYHADHRNAAILVQDASYLLIVPNFCPEAPPLKQAPVICYYHDPFQNPPFVPDVVVNIDDVIDKKYAMMNCHESQVYEWLPFTIGTLDTVPTDPDERIDWLRSPKINRDALPDDKRILNIKHNNDRCECAEAYQASMYRNTLLLQYGEKGANIHFAESFMASEYGRPLTDDTIKELFPL